MMIKPFELEWSEFKRLTIESNTSHIFVVVNKFEDATATYTFTMNTSGILVRTTKYVQGVEEQMMFEQSELIGDKIVFAKELPDNKLKLIITQG